MVWGYFQGDTGLEVLQADTEQFMISKAQEPLKAWQKRELLHQKESPEFDPSTTAKNPSFRKSRHFDEKKRWKEVERGVEISPWEQKHQLSNTRLKPQITQNLLMTAYKGNDCSIQL